MANKPTGTSHEDRMFLVLTREVIPGAEYIRNGYYSFLMSPKGRPMQFDLYFPQLKLAYEYNGKQHYKQNPVMQNQRQFAYLKRCDALKKKLCKELGITLITIDYTKPITADYLRTRIKRAGRGEILTEGGDSNGSKTGSQ